MTLTGLGQHVRAAVDCGTPLRHVIALRRVTCRSCASLSRTDSACLAAGARRVCGGLLYAEPDRLFSLPKPHARHQSADPDPAAVPCRLGARREVASDAKRTENARLHRRGGCGRWGAPQLGAGCPRRERRRERRPQDPTGRAALLATAGRLHRPARQPGAAAPRLQRRRATCSMRRHRRPRPCSINSPGPIGKLRD